MGSAHSRRVVGVATLMAGVHGGLASLARVWKKEKVVNNYVRK